MESLVSAWRMYWDHESGQIEKENEDEDESERL
jgi:hypothetical protein